jgi:hypothetical protein
MSKIKPCQFKRQEVIRHKTTGEPLLVVGLYDDCCIVVSATDKRLLPETFALLRRDWDKFTKETNMKQTDHGWIYEGDETW